MAEAAEFQYLAGPSVVEGDVRSQGFTSPVYGHDGQPTDRYVEGTVVDVMSVRSDHPSPQPGMWRKPNSALLTRRTATIHTVRQGDALSPRPDDPVVAVLGGEPITTNYNGVTLIGRPGSVFGDDYEDDRGYDIFEVCSIAHDTDQIGRISGATLLPSVLEPPYC